MRAETDRPAGARRVRSNRQMSLEALVQKNITGGATSKRVCVGGTTHLCNIAGPWARPSDPDPVGEMQLSVGQEAQAGKQRHHSLVLVFARRREPHPSRRVSKRAFISHARPS